jgi:hypothetical protein
MGFYIPQYRPNLDDSRSNIGTGFSSRARPSPRIRNNCIHYWKIDPPKGPTSLGVCSKCGDFQTFNNESEVTLWSRAEKQRKK